MFHVFILFIPQYENILAIHDETGYNLLQKSVGLVFLTTAHSLSEGVRHREHYHHRCAPQIVFA